MIHIENKKSTYKRVQKRTAERLYMSGHTVYMVPVLCAPDSNFASQLGLDSPSDCSFESFMNSCKYYNCNSETGKYLAFYIKP